MRQKTSHLLSVSDAHTEITSRVTAVSETETLPLEQALQRVLAEDVISKINVPPHRNSAMDGFAFKAIPDQLEQLSIIGNAYAGKPFTGQVGTGECVRIMTGAALPPDTDSVVIQENVTVENNKIHFTAPPEPGRNVRDAGSDIKEGKIISTRGQRLSAADLGVLASTGITHVRVFREINIGIINNGDELKIPGETLAYGEIYNSNRYTLSGLLQRPGIQITDFGVVRDNPDTIEQVFQQAGDSMDVIISSGGVSVGDADHIGNLLHELGECYFSKVAVKPGKPLTFGRFQNSWFFGLPGNPVSVMVTFYIFVLPALRRLMGETPKMPLQLNASCTGLLRKKPGREDYQRGIFKTEPDGSLSVTGSGLQESHRLSSMAQANCLIVLPADSGDVQPGTPVRIIPFTEFH